MSKVICDICGTTYPDTAAQCPICGCSRDTDAQMVADEYLTEAEQAPAKSSHVKGGRFSASNVRKRNKQANAYQQSRKREEDDLRDEEEPSDGTSKVLVGVLVVVIVILLAVTLFVFVKFFLPNVILGGEDTTPETTEQTETEQTTTETTVETEPPTVPCESLELESLSVVELSAEGQYYLIHTVVLPEDTTDVVTYSSSDEAVATVNSEGRVTAVGEGTAIITVSCGGQQVECMVICVIPEATDATEEETGEQTQETTEPETTEAQIDASEFEFEKVDITFDRIGVTYTLRYSPTEIPVEDIEWMTMNSDVCVVNDGVITITGWGTTTIYAEYNGVKIECVVRVYK